MIALEMQGLVCKETDFAEKWFWNAGFGALYDVAANTRLVRDYKRILEGERDFLDVEKPGLTPSLSTRKTQKSVWASVGCALIRESEDRLKRTLSKELSADLGITSLYTEKQVTASIGKRIATFDVSSEYRGALNSYIVPRRFINPARKSDAHETVKLC